MKSILKMLLVLSVVGFCVPLHAQVLSNDNDYGVNKVDFRGGSNYREGQVIVKFKDSTPVKMKHNAKGRLQSAGLSKVDRVFKAIGVTEASELMPLTGMIKNRSPRRAKSLSGRVVTEPDLSTLYCLKFEQEGISVEDAVNNLKALDEVEYAEPNYLAFIQSTGEVYSQEPMYGQQWGLQAINMPQLWAMDKVSTDRPVIAILDTGVDINHPDLKDNIWTNSLEENGASYTDDDANGYVDDVHGWDFVAGTAIINNGMDRNGHGTHCAGIAAAVGDNGIGITGANPDALILPIKVMGDNGTGDVATICRGIDYAIACKAHVLSMSFGSSNSAALYQSLSKALTNYAVLVGAAGNSGISINEYRPTIPTPSFPGAYDIVLGVMASDAAGQLAGFSNYDPDGPFFSDYNSNTSFSTDVDYNDETMWNYDVMAPGVDIMSTYLNGTYKSLNGTSMATPLVAGAISRILQVKGFDYAKDYGMMGDLAMAKDGGMTDYSVFDAVKAASYDESTRQVALALTALEIDDSQGDCDGRFDAGETIEIWPTVRSLWGHAENIKISIEPYDENTPTDAIEVLENNVDFGWSLNSRGSFKSKNPIRVHVNENAYDGMHLPYKIVITSDNLLAGVEQEHVFEIENGIELAGVINEDMTLYPNKHYIVTKNIAIPEGKTLTIMPGTRLEFNENCYLKCEGKLIANGKPDSLIVFTSRDPEKSWQYIQGHGVWLDTSDRFSLYTNSDTTLFTLLPTDATPLEFKSYNRYLYCPVDIEKTTFTINCNDIRKDVDCYYPFSTINSFILSSSDPRLKDPNFISQPLLKRLNEIKENINQYSLEQSEEFPKYTGFSVRITQDVFYLGTPYDTISYCRFENYNRGIRNFYVDDCININSHSDSDTRRAGLRNNVINIKNGEIIKVKEIQK